MELRQSKITKVNARSSVSQRHSRGFTLAEVTIAILVLSSAVIVMISLQSASLDSAFRDERRQKALLAARAILSAIEVDANPLENTDVEAPLVELIAKRPPLDGLSDWQSFGELTPFRAHLKIADWPIPLKNVPQDALKRVTLRVYWSNSDADSVELYYYVPKR